MGNCVAFNFSCDETVNGIIRCLRGKGYIQNLKKNLKNLNREIEDLKAIQDQVAREEEEGGRLTLKTVQLWLTRVENIDTRFMSWIILVPISFNCCVFSVKKLKSEGNFEEVSWSARRSVVEERPTLSTIGQETMLKTTWNRLVKDEVGIIDLHGAKLKASR